MPGVAEIGDLSGPKATVISTPSIMKAGTKPVSPPPKQQTAVPKNAPPRKDISEAERRYIIAKPAFLNVFCLKHEVDDLLKCIDMDGIFIRDFTPRDNQTNHNTGFVTTVRRGSRVLQWGRWYNDVWKIGDNKRIMWSYFPSVPF